MEPCSVITRLEVDFVLPMSQEEEEEEQQQQPTKYLSCYWPDFDQTLNVGSWEHLEQISTVTVVTFVQATFVHIRNISDVIYSILTKL